MIYKCARCRHVYTWSWAVMFACAMQSLSVLKQDILFHISTHVTLSLQWRHNGCDGVSNHQPHNCLPNSLFRRRSKKTSKLRVTDLCAGNSPVTGEFPAQRASNGENVSIWWHYHAFTRRVSDNLMSIVNFRYACHGPVWGIWYSTLL